MNNYAAKMAKAQPIVDDLLGLANGTLFLDLMQHDGDSFRISFFPAKGNEAEAVNKALRHVGELNKGSDRTMQGTRGGVTICLFDVLSCKIVGTRRVKKPIMVQSGETEVEENVYDCRVVREESIVEAAPEQAQQVPF